MRITDQALGLHDVAPEYGEIKRQGEEFRTQNRLVDEIDIQAREKLGRSLEIRELDVSCRNLKRNNHTYPSKNQSHD